jgi:methylmalonyl-CoA mutase cobalamin-binding subunit
MVRLLVAGLSPREVRDLRDGGHEVVVAGAGVSADQLAAAAVQEDVVAVAVSGGASESDPGDLAEALARYDAGDIVVLVPGLTGA